MWTISFYSFLEVKQISSNFLEVWDINNSEPDCELIYNLRVCVDHPSSSKVWEMTRFANEIGIPVNVDGNSLLESLSPNF